MKKACNRWGWLLYCLVFLSMSCGGHAEQPEKGTEMKTDIVALKRFINLPAEIVSGEWQTGEFAPGGDWWLAAVLKIKADDRSKFLVEPPEQQWVELPASLQLVSAFAALKSLPSASVADSQRLSFITPVYPVTPYESSPLLQGKALKLAEDTVFILLSTL